MKKSILLFCFLSFTLTIFSQESPLWVRYPSISPDGKTIAFAYKGDIYTVPVEGGTAMAVTQNPAYDFHPIWSPDSKTIAFASDRYGNFDIYTIPLTGGIPKRLTFYSLREIPSSFTPDGQNIIFTASIIDLPENVGFPRTYLSELYSVPVKGGRIKQILSTPAEDAKYSKDKSKIIYHDCKGPEDYWRKHHTSSITRDLHLYDLTTGKHTKLTSFNGEDRSPVFSPDEKEVYFLSEQFGNNFNVCKLLILKHIP